MLIYETSGKPYYVKVVKNNGDEYEWLVDKWDWYITVSGRIESLVKSKDILYYVVCEADTPTILRCKEDV